MTQLQKVYRFVSVLAAILACVWISGSFHFFDQGETVHPIGFIIVWAGRLSSIGLAIAAGLAAVAPKAALRAMWACAIAAAPAGIMVMLPELWCLILDCGPGPFEPFWEPAALILFAALAIMVGGMHLSKTR